MEVREVLLMAFHVFGPRHLVDARRGGLLQTEEARPQNINGEVMQERRQLVLSVSDETAIKSPEVLASLQARFEIGDRFSNDPIIGLGCHGKIADILCNTAIASCFDIPAAAVLVLAWGQPRR